MVFSCDANLLYSCQFHLLPSMGRESVAAFVVGLSDERLLWLIGVVIYLHSNLLICCCSQLTACVPVL